MKQRVSQGIDKAIDASITNHDKWKFYWGTSLLQFLRNRHQLSWRYFTLVFICRIMWWSLRKLERLHRYLVWKNSVAGTSVGGFFLIPLLVEASKTVTPEITLPMVIYGLIAGYFLFMPLLMTLGPSHET